MEREWGCLWGNVSPGTFWCPASSVDQAIVFLCAQLRAASLAGSFVVMLTGTLVTVVVRRYLPWACRPGINTLPDHVLRADVNDKLHLASFLVRLVCT